MTPDLDLMRNNFKSQLKKQANAMILRAAPEHDQRNAALGVLPPEEAQALRDAISNIRDAYHERLEEIDGIIADTEKTEIEKYRSMRKFDLRISRTQ